MHLLMLWEPLHLLCCSGQRTALEYSLMSFLYFCLLFWVRSLMAHRCSRCSWPCLAGLCLTSHLSCSALDAGWCLKFQLGTWPVMAADETTNSCCCLCFTGGFGEPLSSHSHVGTLSVRAVQGHSDEGASKHITYSSKTCNCSSLSAFKTSIQALHCV